MVQHGVRRAAERGPAGEIAPLVAISRQEAVPRPHGLSRTKTASRDRIPQAEPPPGRPSRMNVVEPAQSAGVP
jgi:hypothetical protein